MTTLNPKHLFISCANEDIALAQWLARKLAARGHPVWFDKLKSLGGEPWPQTVDETIRNRTFRMLALISEHSLRRKKPALERMLAQRVVRQQKIPDFLVPLKVDGCQSPELADMPPSIPFENGWMQGWKLLLEKLDSIAAPRSLENAAKLAAFSFPRNTDLINDTGEKLFANLIRIKSFPSILRLFQADNLTSDEWGKLQAVWTCYKISRDTLIALIPPPPEFADRVRATHEQLRWAESEMFRHVRTRDIAAALITKAMARRAIEAGCLKHPNPKWHETFFLPQTFTEDGQVRFISFEGKKIQMPIRHSVSFRRSGGVIEINFHHFAFRIRVARGLDNAFYIQLTPSLVIFLENGRPVPDQSAPARLRRITKTWNNEEHLNRIMAAEQLLSGVLPAGVNDPVLEPGLLALNCLHGLDEAGRDSDAVKLSEQELDLQEPETEDANE